MLLCSDVVDSPKASQCSHENVVGHFEWHMTSISCNVRYTFCFVMFCFGFSIPGILHAIRSCLGTAAPLANVLIQSLWLVWSLYRKVDICFHAAAHIDALHSHCPVVSGWRLNLFCTFYKEILQHPKLLAYTHITSNIHVCTLCALIGWLCYPLASQKMCAHCAGCTITAWLAAVHKHHSAVVPWQYEVACNKCVCGDNSSCCSIFVHADFTLTGINHCCVVWDLCPSPNYLVV